MGALLLDGAVRLLGVDRRLVERALYYQFADPPVHRASGLGFLHHEFRPGASHRTCDVRGCAVVTINAAGARGPDRAVARTRGSFRVLFFGGSTTYGAGAGAQPRGARQRPRRGLELRNLGVHPGPGVVARAPCAPWPSTARSKGDIGGAGTRRTRRTGTPSADARPPSPPRRPHAASRSSTSPSPRCGDSSQPATPSRR